MYLQNLSPNERLRLSDLKRERCIRKLSIFVEQAWPIIEPAVKFVPGWHIDAICDHLEAVAKRHIRNLLINIPPRHAKSTLVNVLFPAWLWIKTPAEQFLFTSYSDNLAVRDGMKCRRLIESDWYRNFFEIDWQLRDDQNAKARYENTKNGRRISLSILGAITGEGADIIVADDPNKASEIDSTVTREKITETWDETISTRGNDPKTVAKIIIMQRLHEQDLSGHVLEKGTYEHLCLPAEYEGKRKATSIGWTDPRTEPDELLWPARFGRKEIDEIKIDMTLQAAAGQLQQRPAPAAGLIVERHWWRYYDKLPEQFDVIVQSWDLTFKDKEKSDFVVGVVIGRKGADKYLLDMVRARMAFTQQLQAVKNMSIKWPLTHSKYVEDAANGAALVDTLRTQISGLIPIQAKGSKIARAEAVSPQVRSGNVYLPSPAIAPWVDQVVEEWAVFPNGAHDDIVDAMSQALTQLTLLPGYDITPFSAKQVSKWMR